MANSSTSSAHTPGPWSVEREDGLDGWKGISVFSDAKLRIANLVMQLDDREMANAKLIAAAPELLAACERALLLIASYEYGSVRKACEDAIAKAKAA